MLNLTPAYPELFVLAAASGILLLDVFMKDCCRIVTYCLTLLTLLGATWVTLHVASDTRIIVLHGQYVADSLGTVLKLATYGATALSLLYSRQYLQTRGLFKGEYYVLALFAMLGVMVLISAASLLTIYLGIELLSLSLYALVAFNRESGVAAESAMKYFVLGAIASGVLLYGISLLYGFTHTLQLNELVTYTNLSGPNRLGLLFALTFIVAGVAFKFGAVPFHMWLPDVYHGAPTAVTLFIGSVPKIASFALAIRLLSEGLSELFTAWQGLLIVFAVLSMALGNLIAVAQTNLKRMLAYSTISHVGFILLGILAGTAEGNQAALYYTLVYVLMALGAFGIILLRARHGFEADELYDLKGLSQKSPWFALMMMMLMLSMAGIPPFIGFSAKLAVISAILNVHLTWLAVVAVLFSVVGAFYYLRIIKLMYFDAPTDATAITANFSLRAALSVNCLAVLLLGIFPAHIMALCQRVLQ